MKFIDFCTDVTAVGVTVVLSLVLIGGVTSQSDTPPAEAATTTPVPPAAVASSGTSPSVAPLDVSIPRPGALTAEPTRSAPKPLDLADLERSLDELLGPSSNSTSDAGTAQSSVAQAPASQTPVDEIPIIDLFADPVPASEQTDEAAVTPAPSSSARPDKSPVDWESVLADAFALPEVTESDRPNTSTPAPPTRPLIAAPPARISDYMADLLQEDSEVEELPAPPSASRPIGRVR